MSENKLVTVALIKIDHRIERFGAHGVCFKQDLMTRALNDVRRGAFHRVSCCCHGLTEQVLRAVVHHVVFTGLQQQNRCRHLRHLAEDMASGLNPFPHPVIGGAADANRRIVSVKAQITAITFTTVC